MSRALTNKLRYFAGSAAKQLRGQGLSCPSCGGLGGAALDRKWGMTAMRRCSECSLLFRTPTTTAEENAQFYQEDYTEGFTTEVPGDAELKRLLETRFAGEEKNYAGYIAVLEALGVKAGARLFDFGCSWGYGSWQLGQAGFAVDAFEISRPRAAFAAERLGVRLVEPLQAEQGSYDVFFSAHVIEHVPSVEAMVQQGLALLRPGGLLVAFTPNGSAAFRQAQPRNWHLMWGLAHPQLIDSEWAMKRFAGKPLLLTSAPLHQPQHGHPLDEITRWDRSPQAKMLGLEWVEMMMAVVK